MKLFPHQDNALKITESFNLVAYYLDMGLGKTYVGSEKMVQLGKRVNLVVCQKSKIDDWVNHLVNYEEHFKMIYDCTKWDKRDWEAFAKDPNEPCVMVINYDLLFRRPQLLKLTDFTLMLDESSTIQNETAKCSKFVLKMKPANVILLSGTPTSGKYENLWTQIHLLGWKISQELYNRQYVNWKTIDVGGVPKKIINKDDPYKNVDRLKQKLREHGAVFMKTEECFQLPEQTIIPVWINTTKEYKKFQKSKVITIDGVDLVGDTIFAHRLRSRQLCGHYNQDKLQTFKDLAESTQDRLLVFYNWDAELNALKEICNEINRPVSEVNGHCKDLTAYEEESNSITLIQYKAGSMGLNLQKANKIIYFTLTDKSELFEQSKKRIHRIGQQQPCFYYLLLCQNSIEEEVLQALEERRDFTDELFKEE